jgi:hypothetical protein
MQEDIVKIKEKKLPVPLVGLIAGTRGMLGAGAALLFLSDIKRSKRRKLGWVLFSTGVLSTIPLAYRMFRK